MGYEKGKVDLNNIMDIPYEVAKFLFGDDKRLNKFIVAILIVWLLILVVRTIINAYQNQESTWLHRAQKRQNNKFENMNSEIIKNSQERKNQETRKLRKSRSSEWSTESIRAQYIKQHHGRHPGEPKWYSTGWTYNEDTGLWDPPDFVVKESNDRWQWDPEKKIWIDLEKEKRLERYRKNREGKEPTYEEWKAAKLREQRKNDDR